MIPLGTPDDAPGMSPANAVFPYRGSNVFACQRLLRASANRRFEWNSARRVPRSPCQLSATLGVSRGNFSAQGAQVLRKSFLIVALRNREIAAIRRGRVPRGLRATPQDRSARGAIHGIPPRATEIRDYHQVSSRSAAHCSVASGKSPWCGTPRRGSAIQGATASRHRA